jgi:glycosyltransferase involved in cell wall biosynthesis
MKRLLFVLTSAQNFAKGSSIHTSLVFKKALERGAPFDVYFGAGSETDHPLLANIPPEVKLHHGAHAGDLEKLLESQHYDTVFFGDGTDTNIKLPENITPIIVIHDLRFIEVPNDKIRHLYRKTNLDRIKQFFITRLLPRIDSINQKRKMQHFLDHPKLKIVTVSYHTKYSILLNIPKIKDSQIDVLYSPNPPLMEQKGCPDSEAILKSMGVAPKEFFLIVSAGRWFKNSYRAIRALDDLISKQLLGNKKVLVLGVEGSRGITRVKNPGSFIFRDYVSGEVLQCSYQNAYGFIYPSLQEGFGTPPLEAMQYGTPVLAAANSAINEICSSGAYYFNPYSIMEIENRILNLLDDKTFYEQRSKEGIKRAKEIALKQKEDLESLMELIFE